MSVINLKILIVAFDNSEIMSDRTVIVSSAENILARYFITFSIK